MSKDDDRPVLVGRVRGTDPVVVDLAALELRLVMGIKEGKDIHTMRAAEIFGVPESEVTPEMRRKAKAENFGVLYSAFVCEHFDKEPPPVEVTFRGQPGLNLNEINKNSTGLWAMVLTEPVSFKGFLKLKGEVLAETASKTARGAWEAFIKAFPGGEIPQEAVVPKRLVVEKDEDTD